jgi:hypothetical protein
VAGGRDHARRDQRKDLSPRAGVLLAHVAAPALDGRAHRGLCRFLAKSGEVAVPAIAERAISAPGPGRSLRHVGGGCG